MKKYLVIIMITLGFVLSGCSSSEMHDYDVEDQYEKSNDSESDLEDPDPIVNEAEDQGGDATESDPSPAPELENRKIIYKANLHMAVSNPTSVYNNILTTIDSYTAYIEEADITSNRYEVTIRVLSTEFDDFVEDLKTEGELVSYSKTSEDVTNSYSTYEAKIEALETRHARILELITTAEDLDTILMLEEERYEIESELNYYGNKLANYDSLVDYSTVTLKITEAKEEIIVLARTDQPSVTFTEINKNDITVELYNHSEQNVVLHVDVYRNGEFVTEYEENTFSDSRTIVTFDELKSNKEYTFKVTALADDHRVSLQETYRRSTEKTYGNRTTNTFVDSVNILVLFFEYIGLAITGLLPFAVTAAVIFVPVRIIVKKQKGKTTKSFVEKEE